MLNSFNNIQIDYHKTAAASAIQEQINLLFNENVKFKKLIESVSQKYKAIQINLSDDFFEGTDINFSLNKTHIVINSSSQNTFGLIRGIVFELCNADNINLIDKNDVRKYLNADNYATALENAETETIERCNNILFSTDEKLKKDEKEALLEDAKIDTQDCLRRNGLSHYNHYKLFWLEYYINILTKSGRLPFGASIIEKMKIARMQQSNILPTLIAERDKILETKKELTPQNIAQELESERERCKIFQDVSNMKKQYEEIFSELKANKTVVEEACSQKEKDLDNINEQLRMMQLETQRLQNELQLLQNQQGVETVETVETKNIKCCTIL